MAIDRDVYKTEVDFEALIEAFPDLKKLANSKGRLDFDDPQVVQQVTKSLLQRDFNLKIELPDDRLCPPIPNRLTYICWIQDLLDTSSDKYLDRPNESRVTVGLDIGTGASAIYPLLGCQLRQNWKFYGTEIDEKSRGYAFENVARNGLENRISIIPRSAKDAFFDLPIQDEHLDFTMCNPPFYESRAELLASAKAKKRKPFSACTGAEVEMVTNGGEVVFVKRMIRESVSTGEKVRWYSSMLGKLSSVSVIVAELKLLSIDNYAVTEFVQGSKTRRWGVAWSFGDLRPQMDIARNIHSIPKTLLPFPSEYSFQITETDKSKVETSLCNTMDDLDLQWRWKASVSAGVGRASKNVWSRSARRKRKDATGSDSGSEEEAIALAFKVSLVELDDLAGNEIKVRWLQGRDSVLFESFCGMLKRKIDI